MSERVKAYHKLLQFVLLTHRSDINVARLRVFLERMATKEPLLNRFTINDEHVLTFPEGLGQKGGPTEVAVLSSASLVLACMFKAMAMFVGPKRATNDIVTSVEEYLERHPEIKGLDLRKYLPKKSEESEDAGTRIGMAGEAGFLEEEKRPQGSVPVYDQKAMRWTYVDPGEVEEEDGGITPVYEEGAIIQGTAASKGDLADLPSRRTYRKVPPSPSDHEDKVDIYRWLDEPMSVGGSMLIEGSGSAKDVLGCSFLLEGIANGEPAIAILGTSQTTFWREMVRLGLKEEQRALVWVVDWYSYKERPVPDMQRDGRVFVVPKDPRFMGSAVTTILSELKDRSRKRALVSIISPALKFMDMETVFNFAQISRIKFKKGGVSSLFTLETGCCSESTRSQFTNLCDSLMVVREDSHGPASWTMRVHLVDRESADIMVKDVTITQVEPGGEPSDAQANDTHPPMKSPSEGTGAQHLAETPTGPTMTAHPSGARSHVMAGVPTPLEKFLKSKDRDYDREIFNIRMEHWQREGYDVSQLEKVMESDMDTVERVFAAFRDGVKRLRTIERELAVLDLTGLDEEVTSVRAVLNDVTRLEEAEMLFAKVRERAASRPVTKFDAAGQGAVGDGGRATTTGGGDEGGEAGHRAVVHGGGAGPAKHAWEDVASEIFDLALQGYSPDVLETIDFYGQGMRALKDLVANLRTRVSVLKVIDGALGSLRGKLPGSDLDGLAARTKDVFGVEVLRDEVLRFCEKAGIEAPNGLDIEIPHLDSNALGVPRSAAAVPAPVTRPFEAPKLRPQATGSATKQEPALDISDEDVKKLMDSWASMKKVILKDKEEEEEGHPKDVMRGAEMKEKEEGEEQAAATKKVKVVKKVVKKKEG